MAKGEAEISGLEELTLNDLKSKLSTGEELKVPAMANGGLFFEGYLPQGCLKLKIPANTYVEFKLQLLETTISRLSRKLSEYEPDAHILIIYFRAPYGEPAKRNVPRNVRLLRVSELVLSGFKPQGAEYDFQDTSENNLRELQKIVRQEDITLFLGAGLSASAGLPTWDTFLKNLMQAVREVLAPQDVAANLEVRSTSAIIRARYIRTLLEMKLPQAQVRGAFNKAAHQALYGGNAQQDTVSELYPKVKDFIKGKLGSIRSVITYNFDDLLERRLKEAGVKCEQVVNRSGCDRGSLPIYHVHGYLPKDDKGVQPNIVLCEDEYHDRYQRAYYWANVEQLHALMRTRCVFVGLSLADPDLRRLLEFAQRESEDITRHFAFLRIPDDMHDVKALNEHIGVEAVVFSSLGVKVIWYKDLKELPELIARLAQTH